MDDLISEFITETTEGLALLDQELIKLEQNPGDAAILGNIFRIVHTIKGTCGFLGLPRLESVAHASENVLGKIRDKKLEATAQAITLVLESLDTIKELIDYLSGNGKEPEGDDTVLIARLNRFADTGMIDGGTGSAPSAMPPFEEVLPSEVPAEENGEKIPEGFDTGGDFSSFFKGDDDLAALITGEQEKERAKGGHDAPPPAPEKPSAPVLVASSPAPAVEAPKVTPAAPAADKGEKGGEGGGANQSIRVNLDVLENLMQMVSELVLTRNQLLQLARTREDREFMAPLQQLSHITSELQEGVMKTRMQPIGNAWSKFPRLIRDLSLELGKKIDLKMNGAETELDRQLLEMIKDPLTHMVRNSCDHGLEDPGTRRTSGKSETGTVTLSAYHEGGHIIIEIIDDGKGLNLTRIREKALTNGLVTDSELAALSDQQVMQFIFKAGLSTAEKVTSVSGRGVGMDVVRTNIEKIGGTIELDSVQGQGSTFRIKIPLTLAIVSVLLVESCEQKFAIPQLNVLELVRCAPEAENKVENINNALVLRLREKLLPLIVLGTVLELQEQPTNWDERETFIAVCRVGGVDFGVIVDQIFDTEEIVVKPVCSIIKSIPLYSGNTILGDGSVIMILDPNGLARSVGDMDLSGKGEDQTHKAVSEEEKVVSFLLFNAGQGAPKAVPLELVSRLEEIEVSEIEAAGDSPVVQYRGELMRLIMLDDTQTLPSTGTVEIIVFTYDKKTIGLVVDSIIDIVHSTFNVKLPSKNKNCLGSMVIAEKTTDVIDVAHLLSDVIDSVVSDSSSVSRVKAAQSNLLLVEDSPFFRNLTVPFLSAAGYVVTAAENGQEAMKLLSKDPTHFHLIVTDIEMPGMNGFEFTAACRAVPALARLPIIAYTASLSNEVAAKGRSSGMNECILKTDRPGLLQSISRHLMGEKEMAA